MNRNPPVYRGADHPNARFSPEEAVEIRKSFDTEDKTYRQMAKERHCAPGTIFRIVNRKSYREE